VEQVERSGERIRRGRSRIARALAAFDASKPRPGGRLLTQCRRCLLVHPNGATTIKQWCYAGGEHRHWHYWNLKRALLSLGAKPIGFARARGAPAIWRICVENPRKIRQSTINKISTF
jgi:hypothetical protein